ncbi:MAG TPA: hypothetical protein VE869_05265, partial [Gemmatimonas sp.]|nr:hypothetical protein [Gemmatimonas sp.]
MTAPRVTMRNLHAQLMGYVAAIFASPTPEQIAELLAELHPPKPFRIRLKVLYAEPLSVAQIIAQGAEAGRFRPLSTAGLGYALRVPDAYVSATDDDDGEEDERVGAERRPPAPPSARRRAGVGQLYFAVLPTTQPDVSVIVSVAEREDWAYLLREIKGLYPKLVPILLSQREFVQSVATLRDQVRGAYDMRTRELSAKERIDTSTGERTRSLREWTEEAWDRSIRDASDRRQVVTSVTLAFHRIVGTQPNINAS